MQQVQHARGWSFLPKVTFIITLGLITAATGFKASAVDVFTDPVGFITLTANGTNGVNGTAYSLLGLGMTQIPALRGIVGTVSGQQIPVNSTLTPGQYNTTAEGPAYFIEFTTNTTVAGLTDDIVSNDAANVYTANNDQSEVSSGASFKIYPHWTIAKLFGAADQAGLQGGTTPGTADNVLIPNQSTQTLTKYFYYTGSKHGGPNWEDAANNDATNVRIPIDQGFLISKVTGTNLTVMLVGAVKLGVTSIPIGGTNSFIGNVYASSVTTLSTSGLFTGNPATGLVGGTTPSSADNVLIHNDATGAFTKYFFYTGSKHGGPNWEDAANNDATNVQIPLGANLYINLLPTGTGFQWQAPAPY